MATSRKCGWCEGIGHQKRNCETYHKERAYLWTQTIARRKEILTSMAATGVGVGAVIETYDSWDKKNQYIILDSEENIPHWGFFEYRNVKYSKRVRLLENDRRSYDSYSFRVFNVKEGREVSIHLMLKELMQGGHKGDDSYRGWSSFNVLQPSNDPFEIRDENIFKERIWCPKRLASKRELEIHPYNPLLIEEELKL